MSKNQKYPNPAYIHHSDNSVRDNLREIVFGMQDGMVSTLGAITGVAIGSNDIFVTVLAGIAIISVESISMAIGSYTSSRSEQQLLERMLEEEKQEIKNNPKEETIELEEYFVKDGWDEDIAHLMAKRASGNKKLMLREMAYRELKVIPDEEGNPILNGVYMFFAYIVGGIIPLSSYLILSIEPAILSSIIVTLIGLFGLGSIIAQYTKEKWYKTGSHMFIFGGIALLVGYFVGIFSENIPL